MNWPSPARGLLVLMLSVALLSWKTERARGHASLIGSEPLDGAVLENAPRELVLRFDEPVTPAFSTIQILNSISQSVTAGEIQAVPGDNAAILIPLPELEDDLYTVLWKTLSDVDGHINQGMLVFGVGAGTGMSLPTGLPSVENAPPSWPEVLLRWINFASLALIIGAAAVFKTVLPSRTKAKNRHADLGALVAKGRVQVNRLARSAIMSALIVGFGLLAWQIISTSAAVPGAVEPLNMISGLLKGTRWGLAWTARQMLLVLLALAWIAVSRVEYRQRRRILWVAIVILTACIIVAQALNSHAGALADRQAIAVTLDSLHLLGAGLWLGGLATLATAMLPLLARDPNIDHEAKVALIQAVWRPFSLLAVISVCLLAATGLYSAGRHVATLDLLLTGRYGQTLLFKTAVVLGTGLLGLTNAMSLHPPAARPLAALLGKPPGWTPLSPVLLPRVILLEVAFGATVLLLTGALTATPTLREPAYQQMNEPIPSARSAVVDDIVATLYVKPNRPGQNVFTIFAASSKRPPVADIGRVILRFDSLDHDLPRQSLTAEQLESGRFLVTGTAFSLPGRWQVEVIVRRLGMEDVTAQFEWIVPAVSGDTEPNKSIRLESILTNVAALLLVAITSLFLAIGFIPNLRRIRLAHQHAKVGDHNSSI